jgi:hypothetical protein
VVRLIYRGEPSISICKFIYFFLNVFAHVLQSQQYVLLVIKQTLWEIVEGR